jgi:glycosyltransferase involved in cell wall biosynthesis
VGSVVPEERIDGLHVVHPRYPAIPGVPSLNAGLMFATLLPRLLRERRRYDVILASYVYPDGCAGVLLGRALGIPVVVKAHGSDLNRVPRDPPARLQIQKLLPKASRVVVVSKKLGEVAGGLGVSDSKIRVVYNGVDRQRFRPMDRAEARRKLSLPTDGELVVYVGTLAEHKGVLDLLEASAILREKRPEARVAFIGEGELAGRLRTAAEHAAAGQLLVVGRVSHDEVATWIAASDLLTLPSWNEGLPNVIREAHASGRPVVATRVGGIPETVASDVLGQLVPSKAPLLLAEAILAELSAGPRDPELIVKAGLVSSWEESAQALLAVLEEAVSA